MLLMGLRLADGIDAGRFEQRTGIALAEAVHAEMQDALVEAGYLEATATRLVATAEGRLRLDALLGALLK